MNAATPDGTTRVPLREATRLWAKVGLLSFGGPAGQIALMHRLLVDEKRWIGEARFLHALNFCMLLPGPEAQQLATYVGWLLHGTRGGLIAGSLFVLPGFLVILGLSYLYVGSGSMLFVQGVFAGLKPAVVVIVVQALLRVGRRSLRTRTHLTIALLAFVAMVVFAVPFPLVILCAALSAALARRAGADQAVAAVEPGPGLRRSLRSVAAFGALWMAPIVALLFALGPEHVYTRVAIFFSKVAVVSFGGAYAVLSYVSQHAVQAEGWLSPVEMIDGLALAETTPGPLIMVVQFVGFHAAYHEPGALTPAVAALIGALLTVWVTFAPCFLWIFAGAPHVERLRHHKLLSTVLSRITAAVVGAIAQLAFWFALHTLFASTNPYRAGALQLLLPELASIRWSALAIALLLAMLAFRWRIQIPLMLLIAAALGVLAQWL